VGLELGFGIVILGYWCCLFMGFEVGGLGWRFFLFFILRWFFSWLYYLDCFFGVIVVDYFD